MRQFYTLHIANPIISNFFSKGNRNLLLFVFLLFFGLSSNLQAQTTPQQITYQGKLVQNGIPFSGSTTMVFELINPTTNAVAWTETQTIEVQDGLYSVVLGSQTPFTTNFFSQNPSLGLRVSVNGNALTPITVLRAVPYAHAASSVSDNSITSVKIANGTIQTIDIETGGQNKILATDANGLVVWIDRSAASVPTGTAGGDLTGTFPNPIIANDAVTPVKIATSGSPNQILSTDANSIVSWQDANTVFTETDPKVGTTLITGTLPVWNGTTLDNSSITDNGGDVEVNPSADFSVNAGGDVIISSSSGSVDINSNDTDISGNLTVNNDLTVNGVLEVDTNPFDEVITQSEVAAFSPSDAQLMTGLAITDYVSTQIGSITETDPKVGSLSPNTIPRWNFSTVSSLVNGSITDDGTNLSTSVPFIFSNLSPIVYNDGINTSTLSFPSLTNNQIITFPNASGTLLLDGNLGGNFANGLTTLSSDPSKIGLGGNIIQNTNITTNSFDLLIDGTGRFGVDVEQDMSLQSSRDDVNSVFSYLYATNQNATGGADANIVATTQGSGTSVVTLSTLIQGGAEEGYLRLETNTGGTLATFHDTDEIIQVNDGEASMGIFTYDDTDNSIFTLGRSRGDLLIQTSTVAGDILGEMGFEAYDGSSFILSAGIRADAALNPTVNGVPSNLYFYTSNPNGNIEEKMVINTRGVVALKKRITTTFGADNNFGRLFVGDVDGELYYVPADGVTTTPINISAGSPSPWEVNGSNLYYRTGDGTIGIGDFSLNPPQADLHIKRIGVGTPSNIQLTSANGTIGSPTINAVGDVIGEMVFEGFSNDISSPFFREAGKIDMITTANTTSGLKADMRFAIDGIQKMSISDNEVKITEGTQTLLSLDKSSTDLFNFTVGLGSTNAPNGGTISLTAQTSIDASGQGGNLNLLAGQGSFQGGNINITAGNSASTAGGISIDGGFASGPNTRGFVRIQNAGGDVVVGNGGSPNSEVTLNGFLTFPNLVSFSPASNNLYASGGNLFWGSTQLNSAGALSVGNGLTDNSGFIDLGGILTNDVDIDGSSNTYDFSVTNTNTISFDANSFTVSSPTIAPNATVDGGNIDLSAQRIVVGGGSPQNAATLLLEGGKLNRGGNATIAAGFSLNDGGGNLSLSAGGTFDGSSGNVTISAGSGSGPSTGGSVTIRGGDAGSGVSGKIILQAGSGGGGFGYNNIDMQSNGGNVNIGTTGGTAKLNVRATDNGDFNPSNALSLTGLDVSPSSVTLEASALNEARAAFFSRGGSGPSTNPVVLINENNANATASTLRINGGASSSSALFVNGNTSLGGSLQVLNNADFNADVNIDGNLTVLGTINGATFPSDIRYKEQISTLNNSLSNILSVRGTEYYWKDRAVRGERLQFGVIAQEIEEVFPNLVRTDKEGFKSVYYIDLIPVLIEATKEQQAIIDNQKEEINTQKTELENLKKQITELKSIVASLQDNQTTKDNSTSALAQKVEILEKQLTALVESLTKKESTTQTVSLKEE